MPLKYALGYTFYLLTLVLAKPLQTSTQSGDLYPLSTSNDSATSSNTLGFENIHVECNGASYGSDLDITDCELAKAFVPADSEEMIWAERNGMVKQYHPLPYRSMGSKAICYVETSLINGASSAKASTNQIRNAAAMIRHRCYSGGRLHGGIATNIGGDNQLAVVMGSYKAPSEIQCRGTLNAPSSCEAVLEEMPASTTKESFGPLTDYPLPYVIESDDDLCRLRMFSTSSASASDTASWYDVWAATVAIWSVCVRNQQGGTIRDMGDHGNLLLAMTTGSAPLSSDTPIYRVELSNSSTSDSNNTQFQSNGSIRDIPSGLSRRPGKAPMALQKAYALVPPGGSSSNTPIRVHA